MSEISRKTVWVCRVSPDRNVRLEDIPARSLGDLEQRFQTSWLRLVGQPFGDLDKPSVEQGLAMYEYCCKLVGVEPRELTARELTDAFDLVDDDRPTMYTAGLPDPLAHDPMTVG